MAVISSRGIEIVYQDVGAGLPIVLGHAFLCDGTMWRYQLPDLAARYRVLVPDLRGHGRSGPAERSFSLYDLVEDAVAVLDAARVERAVWCGLSIGGMVAMRAALVRPDRVAALVLLDTDAGAEKPVPRAKLRAMGLGVRTVGVGPFVPTIARMMFGATTRRERAELVDAWERTVETMRVPSLLRCLDAILRRDSVLERLPEIEVSALVVVGEEDRTLPPGVARRIHERLRRSRFEVVAGAGHLAALERPEPVTRAILEFVDGLGLAEAR